MEKSFEQITEVSTTKEGDPFSRVITRGSLLVNKNNNEFIMTTNERLDESSTEWESDLSIITNIKYSISDNVMFYYNNNEVIATFIKQ